MATEPPEQQTGTLARRHNAFRPTRRAAAGLAGLAILSAALPISWIFPVLLAVALAGCVGADWAVARRFTPRLVRTEVPTLALNVPIGFEAQARGVEQAQAARLRQPSPPEINVQPSTSAGTDLKGQLVGVHRGTHELPPVVVRTSGPLALASVDHTVGDAVTVTVFPDLPRARKLAAARRRGRMAEEGRIRARLGLGTEFETIRDYSPDDDIRQLNWVATARVGRPMSNQYRIDENRDVMFVVDTGRLMASPVGNVTRLDVALDALVVVAVAADDAGDRVGAVAFDERVTRQLTPRRRGAETIVRALFDLEPTAVESDYERAFYVVGRQKRALVVLFTDLFEEAAARTLIDACPVLLRHHAVLIANCVDTDLVARTAMPAHDVRDVMRVAVAHDILSSRDLAVRTLQGLGASVVEATPRQLGPACVQAYLRLKSRARI
jgi:uncharacterized protein (DUF58 family)